MLVLDLNRLEKNTILLLVDNFINTALKIPFLEIMSLKDMEEWSNKIKKNQAVSINHYNHLEEEIQNLIQNMMKVLNRISKNKKSLYFKR